ncbi:MAG: GntR family transcriptional regulator [Propionibacteriaceae bacterium]|nr:GntR family transcriptional regulator [Propionibacteriaceae bacterium]
MTGTLTDGPDRPLSEQVKEWILDQIFSGVLRPHERIVESMVAGSLGVSHAPVREALKGLEALGVVDIRPFSGARVHRQTHQEILDAYTVRSELEALAVRSALERGADLSGLSTLLGDMYHAVASDDMHELAKVDTKFHEAIIVASGNVELLRVWRGMQPRLRAYITLVTPGADPHWTVALHPPILEALQANDQEAAVEAIKRHFTLARERMEAGLADS